MQTKPECRKAECTLRLMHFGVTSVQEVSSLNGPAASNDRTSRPIETSNSILSTCTSKGSCPRIIVHVQIASTGKRDISTARKSEFKACRSIVLSSVRFKSLIVIKRKKEKIKFFCTIRLGAEYLAQNKLMFSHLLSLRVVISSYLVMWVILISSHSKYSLFLRTCSFSFFF